MGVAIIVNQSQEQLYQEMRNFNLTGHYIYFEIFINLLIQSNTLDLKWKRFKAYTDKIKRTQRKFWRSHLSWKCS